MRRRGVDVSNARSQGRVAEFVCDLMGGVRLGGELDALDYWATSSRCCGGVQRPRESPARNPRASFSLMEGVCESKARVGCLALAY